MISAKSGKLIKRIKSNLHPIEIRQKNDTRFLTFASDGIQSAINVLFPHIPVLKYTEIVTKAWYFNPRPKSILLLGLGGGGLIHQIRHLSKSVQIDVVEFNPLVVEVAERYFGLNTKDENLNIIIGDAAEYVKKTDNCYDLIIMDIYSRKNIPEQFLEERFYQHCELSLNPNGMFVANLLCQSENEFLHILLNTRESFGKHTLCIPVDDHYNIVMFAFRDEDFSRRAIELREKQQFKRLSMDLDLGLIGEFA